MENKAELDLIKDCQELIGKNIQEISTKNKYHIYALEIRKYVIPVIEIEENKAVAVISKDLKKAMSLSEIKNGMGIRFNII